MKNSPVNHSGFEMIFTLCGLALVLGICCLGMVANLIGWRAADKWCERKLDEGPTEG